MEIKDNNYELDSLDLEDLDAEEQEWYEEELLDFIREQTDESESITSLLDEDILYLFELWDEYIEELPDVDNEEQVEIDIDDFNRYVTERVEEDEEDLELSEDDMITLLNLQQDFAAAYEEDDDEI